LPAEERQKAQLSLRASVEEFTTAHRALVRGGALGLTVEGAEGRYAIYDQPIDGESVRKTVRIFLNDIKAAEAGDEAAQARITDIAASGARIARLDRAVRALQDQAAESVHRAEVISRLSLMAALAVLFGEAIFIFWPAHRAIARSFEKLRATNSELNQSKRELQTALGDADIARSHIEHLMAERGDSVKRAAQSVNAPLSKLDGALQQLEGTRLNADQSRELGEATNAVRLMRSTLEEAFSAVGADSMTLLDEAPMNLMQFLDSLGLVTTSWAKRKDIAFELSCDPKLPETIMLDCPRMERVLSNLLSNAVKFTEKGTVTLTAQEAGRGLIRFAVTDTGMGIPSDKIESLFRTYQGAEKHLAVAGTGTGLGLAICRELTELMGGTIRAESVVGVGTTFSLTLPLKEPQAEVRGAA